MIVKRFQRKQVLKVTAIREKFEDALQQQCDHRAVYPLVSDAVNHTSIIYPHIWSRYTEPLCCLRSCLDRDEVVELHVLRIVYGTKVLWPRIPVLL